MAPRQIGDEAIDEGLMAFVVLLRFLGRPADPAQFRHQFAPDGERFTVEHILRAAKRLQVKARRERSTPDRLEKAALPAIAILKDGSFALLARAAPDRVRLQDLAANRPVIEQRAAFEARWSGELILMTTRERSVGASRPFDLTWFIPSIVRFRGLLGEALVGSLFLQFFALITPLFVLAGQHVSAKFEAFPFARYGTVQGEVVHVSRDSNKDDKLGLVYPVRVRLDAADINVDGKRVALTPGMAVNAEIITGDRRVIEYVLSPILRYRHDS